MWRWQRKASCRRKSLTRSRLTRSKSCFKRASIHSPRLWRPCIRTKTSLQLSSEKRKTIRKGLLNCRDRPKWPWLRQRSSSKNRLKAKESSWTSLWKKFPRERTKRFRISKKKSLPSRKKIACKRKVQLTKSVKWDRSKRRMIIYKSKSWKRMKRFKKSAAMLKRSRANWILS